LRLLATAAATPFWVVADEQSQGRGRAGRHWHSPKGNLYATLALHLNVSPSTATQLAFVAAIATYDAAASLLYGIPLNGSQDAAKTPSPQPSPQWERGLAAALRSRREDNSGVPSPLVERDRVRGSWQASQPGSETPPDLRLKWPNDVLLSGAKLAGILIESVMAPKAMGLSIAVGIGINAASAPEDTGRPVAALGLGAGGASAAFEALARTFETWLARWDEGRGFAAIREAWLARAHVRGESLNVRLNGASIGGRFRGIDERGALQLETDAGVVITVNAGDIYPSARD
jgi:BirA family transcriptional regulator, biotin operon repressor / biotin---[acetyl-CoA-carboxylase] ligase